MTRIVHDVVEVLAPPGVGELVERGDPPVRVLMERVTDEVAADEPGAAGDEDVNHPCGSSRKAGCRAGRDGTRPARRNGTARSARSPPGRGPGRCSSIRDTRDSGPAPASDSGCRRKTR